jgi:hypothetical protein
MDDNKSDNIDWEYDYNDDIDNYDDWISSVYDYKLMNKHLKEFYQNNNTYSNNNINTSSNNNDNLQSRLHSRLQSSILSSLEMLNSKASQINNFLENKFVENKCNQIILDPVLVSMLDNDNHIIIRKQKNGKIEQILESNIFLLPRLM